MDAVYEYQTEEIKLSQVKQGDILFVADDRVVETVQVGSKWVDVRDADGKRIVRDLAETVTPVRRRYETEASKKARHREVANKYLRENLESWTPGAAAAAAEVTEEIAKYGQARDYLITRLIQAQANDQVWSEWKRAHENLTQSGLDTVGALEKFVEQKSQDLVRRSMGLSRSTSVIANAVEDAYTAELASFIEHARYY